MTDTPYDIVEYPARAFLQCHPDRLATMARLHGLTPTAVDDARVLELGCGDGANVMAAAVTLPSTEFVGIDLSREAIERGRALATEAELRNVRLEHIDLSLAGERFGRFDYIIAHGLYSWVPEAVRDALFQLIQRVLNAAGLAFVSYNVYPGWYLRRMLREMILDLDNVEAARQWLELLQRNVDGSEGFRRVVGEETADMLSLDTGYFFHDDLAPAKAAFYFREFVKHASSYGLQYVAESEPGANGVIGLKTGARESITRFAGSDRIEFEQYADFLRGRRFRQSLLCHAGLDVQPDPCVAAVRELYAGVPVVRHDRATDGCSEYISMLGGRTSTNDKAIRAVLDRAAAAWPSFLPVREMDDGGGVSESILNLFASNIIELRTVPPPVAPLVATRPEASRLARARARQGTSVTSLHHVEVTLKNSSLRSLLTLLDGTRTRTDLTRDLSAIYPSVPRNTVSLAVDTHLAELHRSGLLIRSSTM